MRKSRLPTPIRYLEAIDDHLEKHFGSDLLVLHEEDSVTVHVDVHVVRPCAARPYFTLLTSGMSDLDMHVPDGLEDYSLAELCLCLPPSWPLGIRKTGWRKPPYLWPIMTLKRMARYPHREKTWFGCGHTVGLADPPKTVAPGVAFTAVLLVHPPTFPPGADTVQTPDGRTIRYLAMIPLFPREMDFRRRFGSQNLMQKLFKSGVTELLDPKRASVV